MASILSIVTVLPNHRFRSEQIEKALGTVWPRARQLAALSSDSSRTRYLVEPLEILLQIRSIDEQQASYRQHARTLALRAAAGALERAHILPENVDLLIAVSCTGWMVPSLDVAIIEELGLRPDVVRLPVAQWGCGGGVAGLGRAHDWLLAYPDRHALVVAVELPSLTFQPADCSWDNFISGLVFGDGAAAAVLDGDSHGLRIEDVAEVLLPNTSEELGFDLRDGGFHVVLSRHLPERIAQLLPAAVLPVLRGWGAEPLTFAAVHAGGSRILDSVARGLDLSETLLASSRQTFADVGNVSSASIFFTLQAESSGAPPGQGLALGIGPGITIQLLKMRR